jgi:DNA mismatch repair protein MutS2
VRVLSAPPDDGASIAFRQAILRDLSEHTNLRADAFRTYKQLTGFWQLLEASYIGQRLDPVRRRVEILRSIVEIIEGLSKAFRGATSGLRRLPEWAEEVRGSVSYRRLAELVEHEERAGVVDLSVQLGRDGELRRFEIVRVETPTGGPFRSSRLGRILGRLRLWFLGYRVREDEVLSRLVNTVFEAVQTDVTGLFGVLGDLEIYLGALGFADLAKAKGLAVCLPEIAGSGERRGRSVRRLFNPFQLMERFPPTPCDLVTEGDAIVIVTGPNSGGKTRLVQALGLMQVLAQAGLFVPAESASLPHNQGLFVSLHAAPRPDQPEGSLGSELLRIRQVFEELDVGGMAILDELCSGTNPSEGEEIFELVLELLAELGAQAFITTHFLQFAARLDRDRKVQNLEFVQAELDSQDRPTYQFARGVASTSLANQTARRLGVTREELRALIQKKKNRESADGPPISGTGEPSSTPVLEARRG